MTESQKVEQNWVTPGPDEIVELTKAHVGAMEMTDVDEVWIQAGMPHVLLTTIGRKSGTAHKVALPTWTDPEGHRIVVGSFAGADRDPAWLLNLRDRSANPRVQCRVQGGQFWSDHEILDDGPERDRVWALLTADRAWYNDYQAKTSARTIPLVRLPVTEAIDPS